MFYTIFYDLIVALATNIIKDLKNWNICLFHGIKVLNSFHGNIDMHF